MLTEQNVIMELTDSSDTVPIGFITTDDGHTLLAVGGKTIELYIIQKQLDKILVHNYTQLQYVYSIASYTQ